MSAKWQNRYLQTPVPPQKYQKQTEFVKTSFVRTLENNKKMYSNQVNAESKKKKRERENFKIIEEVSGIFICFFPTHCLSQWQSWRPKYLSLHS